MKEIIETLNNNGYDCFIVGGYVRDYMLGFSSKDIDFSTNAPIEKIIQLFQGQGKAYPQYYAYHITKDGYEYDITTYRKELRYKKNKPVEIQIASNLGEDLLRRDFTINTFAMDKDGKFVDLLGSKKDLDSKIIRCVGNTEEKLTEDKTRIIRALRFACTLDFDLDSEITKFLENKSHYLNEVPKEYKKKELDRIFESNGLDKFLYYVKRYNMEKYFNISFDKILPCYNRYGVWAQMETTLPFSNEESKKIKSIKKLIKSGNIRMIDILLNSEEIIVNASRILKQEEKVNALKEINNLHSIIDIDIDLDILFRYVKIDNVVETYRLIEKRIIEGNLLNNRYAIEDFLKDL